MAINKRLCGLVLGITMGAGLIAPSCVAPPSENKKESRQAIIQEKSYQNGLAGLVELEKDFIGKFRCLAGNPYTHERMHDYVKSRNIEFNKNDLKEFIFSNCKTYTNSTDALIVGNYMGALLSALTERNDESDKRTIINLDFEGKRFDYLFYGAKKVDVLKIKNLNGNGVLSHVGSYQGGKANKIILDNVHGNGILHTAFSQWGYCKQLLVNNVSGNKILTHMAEDRGVIEELVANNINGWRALTCFAFNDGQCDRLYLNNVEGPESLQALSLNGYKKEVTKVISGKQVENYFKRNAVLN